MFVTLAIAVQQPKYGRPLPAWIKEAIAVQDNRPLLKRQGGGGGSSDEDDDAEEDGNADDGDDDNGTYTLICSYLAVCGDVRIQ